MAVTRLTDLQIPASWMDYVQDQTEEKSRMSQSAVLVRDPDLDERMSGGSIVFNKPHFRDLADTAENISTDNPASSATPENITTGLEIAVRLSRNQSWSSMDLNAALIGPDPMAAIADRTSSYWALRLEAALIATAQGVFANNALATPGGGAVQNDLTVDISGAGYTEGVTDFSAEAFLDAVGLMGDSHESLGLVFVHSTVHTRMLKNDLIDFMKDSDGNPTIPTFMGRRVIVTDKMPNTANVYDTWVFGTGAFSWGVGRPKVPAETDRIVLSGDGGGQDVLVQRIEWTLHPNGHAYTGTPANGGPSNAATTNNLAHEDSWERRMGERKQIRIARLITREA